MSRCVLLVEDDISIQAMVKAVLEKSGYRVLVAADGAAMFAALAGESVDLILLDLGLPDGDALPYIQQVRKEHDLPVVVLTGRQKMDDRLMALGLGANDYLTKPIDPRELVLRIGSALSPGVIQDRPSVAASEIPPPPSPEPQKKSKRDMGTIYGVIALMLAIGVGGVWFLSPEPRDGKANIEMRTVEVTPSAPAEDNASNIVQTPAPEPESQPEPVVEPVPASDVSMPAPEEEAVEQQVPLTKAEILGYGWVLDSKCPRIPDVAWWKLRTHEDVAGYVLRKYEGDWKQLEDVLVTRLAKMYDIAERDSGVIVQTGETLKGVRLERYIEQFALRLTIVRCLAAEAANH